MNYESIRQQYKPDQIKWLLIAESPPPGAGAKGSRHFYRTDKMRLDDRLFLNTIRALYPKEVEGRPETDLELNKEKWLRRLQEAGVYMIEALEESQPHGVKKPQRQAKIQAALPRLIERVGELADPDTKLLLIKSNPYEVAAEPLRQAGFKVLNEALIDYPGQFNQAAYKQKLGDTMRQAGWRD
ncbi:MAG TPA: hypothetical protein VLE72_04625 [Candidatus Saccharimonadales bacterium]|nr:hypothetical protein [Candidatus Saccharimonadales bacterium]